MQVRRERPDRCLGAFFPLSAGNTGMVRMLPSGMRSFFAEFTLICHIKIRKLKVQNPKA
jgi:hypothetical protein